MKIHNDFLGRGWSFPPEFNKSQKEVEMTTDVDDINNSLKILLSTRPGERVLFPKYGCNLEKMLFKPLNLSLTTEMTETIKKAIMLYESRIEVLDVVLDNSEELEGKISINIDYEVRNTNTRRNMVFPFYKGEGTEIQ